MKEVIVITCQLVATNCLFMGSKFEHESTCIICNKINLIARTLHGCIYKNLKCLLLILLSHYMFRTQVGLKTCTMDWELELDMDAQCTQYAHTEGTKEMHLCVGYRKTIMREVDVEFYGLRNTTSTTHQKH